MVRSHNFLVTSAITKFERDSVHVADTVELDVVGLSKDPQTVAFAYLILIAREVGGGSCEMYHIIPPLN